MIWWGQTWPTHVKRSACSSSSLRSVPRQPVGHPLIAQAQVPLINECKIFLMYSFGLELDCQVFKWTLSLKWSMQHQTQPKIVSNSWSFWGYLSSRYILLITESLLLVLCCYCLCMHFISLSLSLSCAPGSRGRWGTVCLAGERGRCRHRSIRGYGHAAIWSQYSYSSAQRQERQVRTVQIIYVLSIVSFFLMLLNTFPLCYE